MSVPPSHKQPPLCHMYSSLPPVNTKAEVRFHVDSADWLPQRVKDRLHTMVGQDRLGQDRLGQDRLHTVVGQDRLHTVVGQDRLGQDRLHTVCGIVDISLMLVVLSCPLPTFAAVQVSSYERGRADRDLTGAPHAASQSGRSRGETGGHAVRGIGGASRTI